jgi:hypothetical protein
MVPPASIVPPTASAACTMMWTRSRWRSSMIGPIGACDGHDPHQLDQFLVNATMAAETSSLQAAPESVQILRIPGTVDPGRYPKPRPFGGMDNPIDQTGFSDHFPIGMHVTETP